LLSSMLIHFSTIHTPHAIIESEMQPRGCLPRHGKQHLTCDATQVSPRLPRQSRVILLTLCDRQGVCTRTCCTPLRMGQGQVDVLRWPGPRVSNVLVATTSSRYAVRGPVQREGQRMGVMGGQRWVGGWVVAIMPLEMRQHTFFTQRAQPSAWGWIHE
jgi:hypothetical protein